MVSDEEGTYYGMKFKIHSISFMHIPAMQRNQMSKQ